jgi:hypothetical protein
MLDAATAKKLDGPAQAAATDPLKIMANVGKFRIGMIGHANTTYVKVLATKRLGHQQRKPPPRGEQANPLHVLIRSSWCLGASAGLSELVPDSWVART